jgi:hypothetical protein
MPEHSDGPRMDRDAIRRELEEVAREPSSSGRSTMAKVTALRTLERLSPRPKGTELPPGVDLDDVAPEDHPLQVEPPDDPFRQLDPPKTFRQLLRWRANLESEL